MRAADRLFRIIQMMRAKSGVVTAREIAEAMEVSQRTIYRDMEHLIASGAPIDGERGIGYLLREKFDAPPLTFTFEQLEALAFGVRAVVMLADDSFARAAREALGKIEANLPAEHVIRLREAPYRAFRSAQQAKPSPLLKSARAALQTKSKLQISYANAEGVQSERVIWPLGLTVFGVNWLLTGWCEMRQDFRDFRIDRITSMQVLPEHFVATEERSLKTYLAGLEV